MNTQSKKLTMGEKVSYGLGDCAPNVTVAMFSVIENCTKRRRI